MSKKLLLRFCLPHILLRGAIRCRLVVHRPYLDKTLAASLARGNPLMSSSSLDPLSNQISRLSKGESFFFEIPKPLFGCIQEAECTGLSISNPPKSYPRRLFFESPELNTRKRVIQLLGERKIVLN